MKELTGLEQDILNVISTRFPYHINEVTMVYRRIKSFDNTIKILEVTTETAKPMAIVIAEFSIRGY